MRSWSEEISTFRRDCQAISMCQVQTFKNVLNSVEPSGPMTSAIHICQGRRFERAALYWLYCKWFSLQPIPTLPNSQTYSEDFWITEVGRLPIICSVEHQPLFIITVFQMCSRVSELRALLLLVALQQIAMLWFEKQFTYSVRTIRIFANVRIDLASSVIALEARPAGRS